MANLRIEWTETNGDSSRKFVFENTNSGSLDISLIKRLLGESADVEVNQSEVVRGCDGKDAGECNMRIVQASTITPAILRAAANDEALNTILKPFDEIDIPTDNGKAFTAVCAYVEPEWARFVFKNCLGRASMNCPENKRGYFHSYARKHIYTDVWRHIAPEWQSIIRSRTIDDIVGGEAEGTAYADPIWLLSPHDIVGSSEKQHREKGACSFPLPILQTRRTRMKTYEDGTPTSYWLRQSSESNPLYFNCIEKDGGTAIANLSLQLGLAAGFDIG